MSNLKKLLAVIMTVCMLATFVIPAVAESDLEDWEICEELGIIKGTGAGVTDDYLASAPLRYQGAILFLRLLGLEDEAYDFDGDENFDDADQVNEKNQALLAFLKANPDLGFVGVGDNKFAPLEAMTAKQYYKVLLTALGYKQGEDYEWANVLSFAAGMGLYQLIDVEDFTIEALCIGTVEALKADVKDADATLLATLVDAGVVDGELAEELGLYDVPVVALAIKGAVALNYREIVVSFTKAVDAAQLGKADNYALDGGREVEAVEAADDNMSVLILIKAGASDASPVAAGGTVEITVKKAIMGADTKIKTGIITDGALPFIVGAEAVGNSGIKVTFSEPVKNLGGPADYKLDGLYFAQSALPKAEGRVLTLKPTTRMAAGEHELSVYSGITDYAGYGLTAVRTVSFTVEEDSTPPSVSFKSATQKKVVVEFSEAVSKADIEAAAISFSPGVGTVTDKKLDSDGVTFTVEVSGTIPASGTTTMTIPKAAVIDMFGNSPSENLTVSFQASADTDRPEVVGVAFSKKDQDELFITFNKEVDLEDGIVELTEINSKGETTKRDIEALEYLMEGTPAKANKKVVLVKPASGTYNPDVTYTIVVKNFTDAPNPLKNKMIDYVISGLKVDDLTPPEYEAPVIGSGRSLFISFDDSLDSATVIASNFAYRTAAKLYNGLPSGVAVTSINNGKTIKITWPDDGDYKIASVDDILSIQYTGLKGTDGNAVAGNYIDRGTEWDDPTAGAALASADVTGKNTIVAKLNSAENLIFNAAQAIADFELVSTSSSTIKYNLINASYDSKKSEITFTTYENFKSDATIDGATVYLTTKSTTSLANIFGEKLGDGAVALIGDKFAPSASVKTGDADGEIVITFSEAVDTTGGNVATDILLREKGALVTPTSITGDGASITQLIITAPKSNVEYTVQILSRLAEDLEGNELGEMAATAVKSK